MQENDVIEGIPKKSLEDIIKEVAEEENMTAEEVEEAVKKFKELTKRNTATKPKLNKSKKKNKRKMAKKSRKGNR